MGRSSGIWSWFVLLVSFAPGVAADDLPPRGPLIPMDPNAQPCTYPQVEISGDVVLDTGCIYDNRFLITSSDTTLDCNGAQLIPANPDHASVTVKGEIENVTVKNCYSLGGRGINVRGPARLEGESHQDLRDRSPRDVVVRNVLSSGSTNCGIYFHHHTVGAVLADSIVEDNNRVGIYFGAESQGHTIRNCLVRGNGYYFEDGSAETGWHRREGLAVDASAGNLIEDNHFDANAFGGIFLYKNCWEYAESQPNSWQRIQHSSDNTIRNNTFTDMDIGVWVAARQSRNLLFMYCGDPTPYENPIWIEDVFDEDTPVFRSTFPVEYMPFVGIWPDFAEDNLIEGNTFEDVRLAGVRIEDDRTRVTGNLFVGDFDFLFLGAPFRARLLGQPVRGTIIRGNHFLSPRAQPFTALAALVPGEHAETVVEDNHRACLGQDGFLLLHGQVRGTEICLDGLLGPIESAAGPQTSVGCASSGFSGGPAGLPGLLSIWLLFRCRRRPGSTT